jgi:hypothetical protein
MVYLKTTLALNCVPEYSSSIMLHLMVFDFVVVAVVVVAVAAAVDVDWWWLCLYSSTVLLMLLGYEVDVYKLSWCPFVVKYFY